MKTRIESAKQDYSKRTATTVVYVQGIPTGDPYYFFTFAPLNEEKEIAGKVIKIRAKTQEEANEKAGKDSRLEHGFIEGAKEDAYPDRESLYKASDDFGNKHSVWMMDHKCKPFAAIQRAETKEIADEIEAELTEQGYKVESVKFSRTAGCSCGCSPGYKVKWRNSVSSTSGLGDLGWADVWMTVNLERTALLRINRQVAKSETLPL